MEWIAALLFVSVVLVLLAGFPVAFSLGGTALIFAGIGIVTGTFTEALLLGLPNRVFGIMTNETLVAVPLFVFMGVTLERARIAEELLETLSSLGAAATMRSPSRDSSSDASALGTRRTVTRSMAVLTSNSEYRAAAAANSENRPIQQNASSRRARMPRVMARGSSVLRASGTRRSCAGSDRLWRRS